MLMIPFLPDKYEKVISMRFEEEMTIKEIAEATQQPNNTVVVQIHRGIDKLAILIRIEEDKQKAKQKADKSSASLIILLLFLLETEHPALQ